MNENTRESPKNLRKKKWKQREALVQVHMVHPDPKKSQIFICRKESNISSCPQNKRRTKDEENNSKSINQSYKKI